jgi:hypothetical protein
MPQTVDRIDFARPDVDPSQWPKLSCGTANQLVLAAGSLRLEANRELFFADNGQIRSFDDNHRLVFNRASSQVELHAASNLLFLTGTPAPAEKLRIRADGNVGIGTDMPDATLHVVGNTRADGNLNVRDDATINGSLTVAGAANLISGAQIQGDLQVNGIVNATDIHKQGVPLRVSQWSNIAGGISYEGGNVGIGTLEPQRKLQIGHADASIGFAPSDVSPNAGYIRFGDNTGWKLHFGRSREGAGGTLNEGTTGVLLTIQDKGNIGIGELDPLGKLVIKHEGHINVILDNSGFQDHMTLTAGSSGTGIHFSDTNRFFISADPYAERYTTGFGKEVFTVSAAGDVRYLTSSQQMSSRMLKENIFDLPYQTALEVLECLNPVQFNRKADRHHTRYLGFIAEEVPDVVASHDHQAVIYDHIVTVLTSVIKEQQKTLSVFWEKISLLEEQLKHSLS